LQTLCRIGALDDGLTDSICFPISRPAQAGRDPGRVLAEVGFRGVRAIDPMEALHQVELQEAFDLAYDEYQELTRPAAQGLVDEIIADIVADGRVTREER